MSKLRSKMATRCELALMGKVVEVLNSDEVVPMTKYLMSAMGIDEELNPNFLQDTINKYSKDNVVKYLVCNTVMGMKCITYLLDTTTEDEEEKFPAPFEEDYGTGYPCAFSYVLNLECDWCSEFGDVFFKKMSDGFYHRKS